MSEQQRLAKLLRSCAKNQSLDQGIKLHAALVKMGFEYDIILSNNLVDVYGKCGRTDAARKVFDRMSERNIVSWTVLMIGYLQQGFARESLSLFCKMGFSGIKPNEFTFSTNLKACSSLGISVNGIQIHTLSIKTGFEAYTVVGNSLIDMYAKCKRIDEANQVFDKMLLRNRISWNTMIAGYTHGGNRKNSLLLFRKMQEHGEIPDEFTYASILKVCSSLEAISCGTQIHSSLITNGFSSLTILASALIDLYVKCQHLTEAQSVFYQTTQKNIISWTAMITGYAQEGKLQEAMDLFFELQRTGIQIDSFVLSSIMGIFADFALMEQGKQIHSYTIKTPSGSDVSVANSTIDMYLKCGLIEEAQQLFEKMPERNVVSWTVMITGYGKHGHGKDAILLFEQMQSQGILPDEVTFLAILSACSHAGLVEESFKYFAKLQEYHQIWPRQEHYACMVDLLGRAGRLKEAKEMIESMPMQAGPGLWQTLLGACRVHGDVQLGREVGVVLMRVDGENPVNYVMMSNIYAEAGKWGECERVRELMKKKGLKKEAGWSWVEIGKEVHFFYGGDKTHPLIGEINGVLREMERRMRQEIGYVFEVRFDMHDVEEESKMESLRVHSEKLAIGLELVCGGLSGEGVIRVFKNLRVCGDCHEFIKGLSKVLNREILVRDANRFHRFQGGVCSCGDYW